MSKRLILSGKIMFFLLLLSVVFITCILTLNVSANSENHYLSYEEESENTISQQADMNSIFTFTLINETECDVRLADKTATKAIIPDKVEIAGKAYDVTVVATNGFTSATNLELVRLPKSVKTIGANAFTNCKALTSLTLPAVETIGANAFAMTKMEYLIIPKTVTSVASTILRGTNTQVYVRSSLEEGMATPEGWVSNWNGSNKNQNVEFNSSFIPEVKYEFVSSEIATFALGDNVDLRNGGYFVTGYQEFCTIDAEDYKEVYIPATYTGEDGIEYPILGIDSYAFSFNDIEKVTIGYSDLPIRVASESFYGLNGSVITYNREVEFLNEDWEGNEAISESVFTCSTVLSIILPSSIQYIGNNMFDGCENLRDIHFIEPDSTLSPLAESNISIKLISTQKVDLPNAITHIGDCAFNLTKNILELHIPNSVQYIGEKILLNWSTEQVVYVDLVADDPLLENWSKNWSICNQNENFSNIVFKLSDKEFNITYNVNKEYHNNSETYISNEGLVLLPVEMAGYTFGGWYLDENFKQPIENIAIGTMGDLNLYAKLIPNTYLVEYNKNCPQNASYQVLGDMTSSTHTFNEISQLRVSKYTLKGWTFKGWNTKEDGTGQQYSEQGYVTNLIECGTVNLYAQWEQKKYEIDFSGNRPNKATSILEGVMLAETHLYEEEFSLKKVSYSLKGWTFKGWNTKEDGTGITYKDEEVVKSLDEVKITLYAQWEVGTYNVIYNQNKPDNTDFEVKGEMGNSTHIFDTSSFLRTNAYTLEGYTFIDWNTKSDGSGKSYINGAEVQALTSEGSIELYAQWKANSYTIHYKPNRPNSSNSVLGETHDSNHVVDIVSTLSANGYSLKGWTFKGWNTKEDGTGTSYANKDSIRNVTTTSSVIELYAQWEVKTYTIKYLENTPSSASNPVLGATSESTHKVDSPSSLSLNEFILKGWTFKGWNTKADGTGTFYTNKGNISIAIDEPQIQLYAQWEANQYTISYEKNKPFNASHDVLGEMNVSVHIYDSICSLETNSFALEGWIFKGWNTKEDGTGISYTDKSDNEIVTNESLIRLYAQWEANKYIIVYVSNGGVGNMENTVMTYDTTSNLAKNTFTYTGKRFLHWTSNIHGSEKTFDDEASIMNLTSKNGEQMLLYARWENNEYYVQYNPNKPNDNREVQGKMEKSYHTMNEPKNLSENLFTFEGWNFIGWSLTEKGEVLYRNKAEVLNLTYQQGETVNLYAQWSPIKYKIYFKPEFPSFPEDNINNTPIIREYGYDQVINLENIYISSYWEIDCWEYNNIKYEVLNKNIMNLTKVEGEQLEFQPHWIAKNVHECEKDGVYQIFDKSQLGQMSTTKNYKYKLLRNLSVNDWNPLEDFKGELDLNGFTITYKQESLGTNSNYGFFLENHGTIKNGTFIPYIVQPTINSSQQDETYIGGVVAKNYGIISNVDVLSSIGAGVDTMTESETKSDINVRSNMCIIGGIAGLNSGTIENCTNQASLGGSYYIGGIVGKNMENAEIKKCTNEGKIWYCSISGNHKCVGGIVAAHYEGAIIDGCNSNAEIVFAYRVDNNIEDFVYMARIVGWSHTSTTIDDCTGLTEPIINNITGLTSTQLSYIKTSKAQWTKTFNVGKESADPNLFHEHDNDYFPDPKDQRRGHVQICLCGYISAYSSPHVIRYADRNNITANCIYCHYTLTLKNDLYIVEGGMMLASTKETDVNCILQEDVIVLEKDESDENSKNEIQ